MATKTCRVCSGTIKFQGHNYCSECNNAFRRIRRRQAKTGFGSLVAKSCTKCHLIKPLGEFHPESRGKHGVTARCATCHWQASYESRKRNDTPERRRVRDERSRLKRFGLTSEGYDSMLAAQGGKCAICANEETLVIRGKVAQLAIDHDHETGDVRGLLCSACNTGLGKFEDDIDRLAAAINYLREKRCPKR